MGISVDDICEGIGLSDADVYEAIAEYKRSLQEAGLDE